jgi:hypothetical protein
MLQVVKGIMAAIYAALFGAAALLDASEIILFTNDADIDENTVVGDLTEPTFTSYAATATTGWEAATDSNGFPFAVAEPIQFQPTDATGLPQIIRGAALIDAGGDLICATKLDTPITVAYSGQVLYVTPKFKLGLKTGPGLDIETE